MLKFGDIRLICKKKKGNFLIPSYTLQILKRRLAAGIYGCSQEQPQQSLKAAYLPVFGELPALALPGIFCIVFPPFLFVYCLLV